MKQAFLFLCLVVVVQGCATTTDYVPRFDDSNANLIKQSVESIAITDSVSEFIRPDDKVAIVSIESDKTKDHAIPSLIEDTFIKKMIDDGYQVLERDDNMLFRLMSESEDSFTYFEKYRHIAIQSQSQPANSGIQRYSDVDMYNDIIPTSLIAADKIISYRIIESGIVYEKLCKSTSCDSLRRMADTIILLRTTDSKTGQILDVSELRGSAEDRILMDSRVVLENYHMHFYRFGYPVTYGNNPQIGYTVTEKDNNKAHPAMLAAFGVVIAAVAVGLIVAGAN